MKRREALRYIAMGVLVSSAIACDEESKPAATATVFNNQKIHQAVSTLDGIVGDLETDSEDFGGGGSWRDTVEQVHEHVGQLRGALDDLRGALGYS